MFQVFATGWIALGIALAVPGLAAGADVELARGAAPQHPQQPQVAVDARGAIHVVYGVGDVVYYRRSEDDGESFSPPVSLPAVHAMSLGLRRGPRLVVTDSALCVTAIGGKQGKGRDGDIVALRSTDGGQTWHAAGQVNDVADAAREGLHGMAAGPRGVLCCVWLDLRARGTQIMAATSSDGGATWSKNVVVYRSPEKSVCECCHPSVAYDAAGRLVVLWRNSLAGARDMYFAVSADGGQTFGEARKLGTGTWTLKACPMDGGSLALTPDGKLVTVWRRDKSIFLTEDGSPTERLLGAGEQPSIAATAAGSFVVWLEKRGGNLRLLAPSAAEPTVLAAQAGDPVITAGPGGRGPVVLVWESRSDEVATIKCQVLSR